MGRLEGKVAIITGSTSGMGRDTAFVFAKEGAKVVVVGRRENRAQEVVEQIKKDGGEAIYVVADMLKVEDIKKANFVDYLNATFKYYIINKESNTTFN